LILAISEVGIVYFTLISHIFIGCVTDVCHSNRKNPKKWWDLYNFTFMYFVNEFVPVVTKLNLKTGIKGGVNTKLDTL